MAMSELGASVVQALGFLRGFFGDVSKLLTVVENEMTGAGLASPWGATSMWRSSNSYWYPARWVPNYVVRQYVQAPQDGEKLSNIADWYAFCAVHFAPHKLGEPTAIWGMATLHKPQNVWTSLGSMVLTERGPKFLTQQAVDEWQAFAEPAQDVREFRYRARAVVDLCDETMVQRVVVQPLLELVEQARMQARGAPQEEV
jgi:hypothetical protein